MPVYNGERYLAEAIESLLAQTFRDFELIVADNASTDATPEMVREYARRDSRVRLCRADVNGGLAWNYSRLVDLASGEYFKWAAHDDLCAPQFLARLVDTLDRHPEAAWCHSWTGFIDETGAPTRGPTGPVFRYSGQPGRRDARPEQRFRAVMLGSGECYDTYGLFRLALLRPSGRQRPWFGSDKILIAEMSLKGTFLEVPDVLFFNREHKGQSTWSSRRRQEWIMRGSDPGPLVLPRRLRCVLAYLGLIGSSALDGRAKVTCLAGLARCCLQRGRGKLAAAEMSAQARTQRPLRTESPS